MHYNGYCGAYMKNEGEHTMTTIHDLAAPQPSAKHSNGDWQRRLQLIVKTMREISTHTDPQEMVRAYGARLSELMPGFRMVSLSRRGLPSPQYRITRSSLWKEDINPWTQPDKLPLLDRGLLGDLLYGGQPVIIDQLEVPADDPAAEYLDGQRSLVAIPLFDNGEALNMVVLMREQASGFAREEFPELVWVSNLFGRATHTLVLKQQVNEAYEMVDRELRAVADIQRSLLPQEMPDIPTMSLAAHYQTSQRAGGDYYDIFPLPGGMWGILIADVSGHGTPAAVLMAVMHSIVHSYPGPARSPGQMLAYVNERLALRYTKHTGNFITAFYGIYCPVNRNITYSSAGHNPPRIKRCVDGSLLSLDQGASMPLGIMPDTPYSEATSELQAGDQIIVYTDGITEAMNARGELFGVRRLDEALENCHLDADALIQTVLSAVEEFTGGRPPDDDRTMLVAKIS